MTFRETAQIEFKEQLTNTFLKTVSAFANYDGGTIYFGIQDDGTVNGMPNPIQDCLTIEQKIDDSIDPTPKYTLEIRKDGVIILEVEEGLYKPYCYRNKAYCRNDSATVEVDRLEMQRLILEGSNRSYDELEATTQELSFTHLEKELKDRAGIKDFSLDTLRTLGLYSKKVGYNRAAELLADVNQSFGIECVRFGKTISQFLDRETIEHCSVLEMYDRALSMYRKYYTYEEVQGSRRETIQRIPEEAFREAVANSLIHRSWDIRAAIQVAMYEDHIEVTSPGNLPRELSEEEYLNSKISVFRNPILASVFYRLGLIEHLGTGTFRIRDAYNGAPVQPRFQFSEHFLTILLPVTDIQYDFTETEEEIYKLLSSGMTLTRSQIDTITGYDKQQTHRALKRLMEKGLVEKIGSTRSSKYKKI